MSDFRPCRECRNWRECVGKDFFLYSEIRYCTHQMIWLIKNLEMLEQGEWPNEPDDNRSGTQVRTEASFTKAGEMWAETKTRLESLPQYARDHLLDIIEADVPIDYMRYTPRMALYYISGRRKGISFSKWKWQIEHRKNEDKTSSKLAKVGT